MDEFVYSPEKDIKLKQERGLGFEEIIILIGNGHVLDVLDHPNAEKYPTQKIYVLDIKGYVWLVPYVQKGEEIFLKTAFPSRKHTKQYLEERDE